MDIDVGHAGLEQFGHGSLREPDCLAVEPDLEVERAIVVNEHLPAGRKRCWQIGVSHCAIPFGTI